MNLRARESVVYTPGKYRGLRLICTVVVNARERERERKPIGVKRSYFSTLVEAAFGTLDY